MMSSSKGTATGESGHALSLPFSNVDPGHHLFGTRTSTIQTGITSGRLGCQVRPIRLHPTGSLLRRLMNSCRAAEVRGTLTVRRGGVDYDLLTMIPSILSVSVWAR